MSIGLFCVVELAPVHAGAVNSPIRRVFAEVVEPDATVVTKMRMTVAAIEVFAADANGMMRIFFAMPPFVTSAVHAMRRSVPIVPEPSDFVDAVVEDVKATPERLTVFE